MSINVHTSFQTDSITEMINPVNEKIVDMNVVPLGEDIFEEVPISVLNLSQTSLLRDNARYLNHVTDRQQIILFRDMKKTKLCHEFQEDMLDLLSYKNLDLFYGVILDNNDNVNYAYILADYALNIVKIYPITKKYWNELNENYNYLDIAPQYSTTNLSERLSVYDKPTDTLVNLAMSYDESVETCGSDIISCIILSKIDSNQCYKNMKYNIVLPVLSNFCIDGNIYTHYVREEGKGSVFSIESQVSFNLCNIYLNNNITYRFHKNSSSKIVDTGLIPEVYNCSSFARQLTEITSFLKYNSDMLVSLLHYYYGENYFVASNKLT